MLNFDPEVDTFGDRILEIDSTKLTYEQAYENPTYIDKALDLENASNTGIPNEFTQFVLRKMAVYEISCRPFEAALDPRAKQYLLKLIGPQVSEERRVHPGNPDERTSLFRSLLTKLFCQKLVMNLRNENCENQSLNLPKLACIFPFQVCKSVPEYRIGILKNFDDRFYNRMQHFLDEHFDKNVPVRETTALFLNNIRHFFDTKFSSKQQSTEYLSKFPRLNDKGIVHFQYLYREYRNVRKHFYNCKRRVPHLYYENDDFRTMPERNIDEIASLLQSIVFRTKPEMYEDLFKKYLFFFVHSLEIEKNPTPVFFIDDMLYQCLKSLRRFRTLREDPINMLDDLAMITLLWLFYREQDFKNYDGYSINLTTLRNIKEYITNFVSNEKNVQIEFKFKTDLYCTLPYRVNNTIAFDVCYANKKHNCRRGIMYFLHQLLCSVLSPGDNPIRCIVCYCAFIGQENRFAIPQDRNIIESVRNFVRLSTKRDISKVFLEPVNNIYLIILYDRLTISQT